MPLSVGGARAPGGDGSAGAGAAGSGPGKGNMRRAVGGGAVGARQNTWRRATDGVARWCRPTSQRTRRSVIGLSDVFGRIVCDDPMRSA